MLAAAIDRTPMMAGDVRTDAQRFRFAREQVASQPFSFSIDS